ncbi:septation protein A [Parvibaculum sedimenti]|uniref:Inner membrane-spanning protein YciB n=1 Tax=Parvibaculum sedimenti TaxID=2608632 RepID=A0A6N6VLD0_9HYPH|nr:septation protein A [Parvibaculum sedimenti]KAB7742236.1 septation protein A [Parvibaculum sedimenti]
MSEAQESQGPTAAQWLRMGLELGPLVVFFLVNAKGHLIFGGEPSHNIFYATGVFMVVTVISLAVSYWKFRRVPTMPLVTGVFVVVFGTLTLVLQNDVFIKLKPTLVNSLFAAALLGAAATGRPLMKQLFDAAFDLTDEGWMILTRRWGWFFLFLALVNEAVWRSFSTDFWVSFKLFGIMPLTIVFGMAQMPVLTKYATKEASDAPSAD